MIPNLWKGKYRVEKWPAQVERFSPLPKVYFNPQYYDQQARKWRPYTRTVNGIMKPVLYPTKLEAEQYVEVMRIKDKRSKAEE